MKICFFSGDITRSGGTEKVGCQIANALSEQFEVHIISLTEVSDKTFYDLNSNIKRHSMFSYVPNGKKQYFSVVSKLRKYLKENKIDILIDIDTIMSMFSLTAAAFTNVKLISWEHFNYYETLENKLRIPIRKLSSRFADCIVTLTDEDRQYYMENTSHKAKITRIYNPMKITANQKPYNIQSKTLISVGRLANQKGFDILLNVAEKVFKKHPDWEWLVLGEGDDREKLEKIKHDKKLKQVKFIGRQKNVSDYLSKAAIFVMTSRYEGFPLVLIEAKENNLPVISFICRTGPAELVDDEKNGYLVDCFDVQQMANRICFLIENPELRENFSKNALLDTEKMNFESIKMQWLHLLQGLRGDENGETN